MPRLVGKRGSVYFGGNKIADVFDIILELNQELLEATVKFEVHDVMAAGGVNSHLTCQRYTTDSALVTNSSPEQGGSVVGSQLVGNIPAAGNQFAGATVTWTFWAVDGSAAPIKGFKVTGEGFIERVTQNTPRGMATEVWEIRNTIMPTITS